MQAGQPDEEPGNPPERGRVGGRCHAGPDRQQANIFGPLGGTTPSAPNIKTDAMFPAKAFDALIALVAKAAAKHVVDGQPERLYEPLDHLEPD
jgi:hypothetical protein